MLEVCQEKAMLLKMDGLVVSWADQLWSRPRNFVAMSLGGFVATIFRGRRSVDGDAFDSQLFHAASKSVGMESKDLSGAPWTFNDPFRLPENIHDVTFFNLSQGRRSRCVFSVGPVGTNRGDSLICGCGLSSGQQVAS